MKQMIKLIKTTFLSIAVMFEAYAQVGQQHIRTPPAIPATVTNIIGTAPLVVTPTGTVFDIKLQPCAVGEVLQWQATPAPAGYKCATLAQAWAITGNTGTNPATNFIGTADNTSVVFRANNVERMRLLNTGELGIGTISALQKLDVAGNMRLTGSFMPNNQAGTTGQILTSQGLNVAPVWTTLANNNIYTVDGALAGARTVTQGANNLTFTGIGGITKLSGAAATPASINIGRTTAEANIGTAAAINQFFPSTVAGDLAIRNATNIFIGNGAGVANAGIAVVNNNVGINRAVPTERLDVNGNLKFSGALMPNNLAGTAGQLLSSSGAGIAPTWVAAPAAQLNADWNSTTSPTQILNKPIIGGLNNMVAKFTINGANIGNSQIFDNGTGVGVSTTTPKYTLHVNKTGTSGIASLFGNGVLVTDNTSPRFVLENTGGAAGQRMFAMKVEANAFTIGSLSDNAGAWVNNNIITALANGNAGSNTIAPTEKWDVNGNLKFSGAIMPANNAGTTGQVLTSAGAGVAPTWQTAPDLYKDGGKANTIMTLSGVASVTVAGQVSWTNRFIVLGGGRGATSSSADGFFDINMPPVGTVITGVGGASNVTVTASGIPLVTGGTSAGWTALWYQLPASRTAGFVAANLRVAGFTADFVVPPDWVLVAVRNADNGAVRFGDGQVLSPGATATKGAFSSQTQGGWGAAGKTVLTFTNKPNTRYLVTINAGFFRTTSGLDQLVLRNNGVQVLALQYFFNAINDHRSVGGSFILNTTGAVSNVFNLSTPASSDLNDFCIITAVEI